ncbi:zinc metalloprotease HtpX [Candidatus Micrarchaeota archaeon]|nr:zinc metalloprotease HtpX [Candidatus Micrarchaeota archaeon]
MASFYDEIQSNQRRTYFLFASFLLLLFLIAYAFGFVLGLGNFGFVFAVVIAVILTLVMYHQSDKIVLSVTKARPVTKEEFPYLYHSIEALSLGAGIPQPRLYVMDEDAMNAFATGRDPQHAIVVVTTGLLKRMNRLELEGVLSHELSHIRNYDIKVMMLATVFAGSIIILSDILLRSTIWGGGNRREGRGSVYVVILGIALAILAPIFAQLIKMAVSRKREFMADASAAQLTRYPAGLAGALEKIEKDSVQMKNASNATSHLFISNPLKRDNISKWFSTHPPIQERIQRLKAM